jgi:hypothetical protein
VNLEFPDYLEHLELLGGLEYLEYLVIQQQMELSN